MEVLVPLSLDFFVSSIDAFVVVKQLNFFQFRQNYMVSAVLRVRVYELKFSSASICMAV